MRPMPIDDIGTVVDTEVSQFTQGPAVLAKEGLRALRQVVLRASLCTSVKRDDHKVAPAYQVVNDAPYGV